MKKHLAALIGATLVAGGLTISTAAEAVAAPSEIKVVPAPTYPDNVYPTDALSMAGRTGFLHRRTTTSPWLWTRYADRHTVVVTALDGVASYAVAGSGGDVLRLPSDPNGTTINTLDLSTMTRRELTVPANAAIRVLGNTMVVATSAKPAAVELRRFAIDGSHTTTPVTGVPEEATSAQTVGGDDHGAVLRFNIPGGSRYALVDFDSARVALMPALEDIRRVVLTDESIGMLVAGKAWVFSRVGVADGTNLEPHVFPLPTITSNSDLNGVALAGEDLIVLAPHASRDQAPVLRYSAEGGAPTQIGLAPSRSDAYLRQGQDGALFVGGSKGSDWGVRKATAAGQSVVLPLSGPQISAGVTLSAGTLRHITAVARPGEKPEYRSYDLPMTPGSGTSFQPSEELIAPVPCAPETTCVRVVDGSDRGASYLSAGSSIALRSTKSAAAPGLTLPSASGLVVDASDRYRLVNGTGPARQYLIGMIGFDDILLSTTPMTGAALWYSTLWTATNAGTLQPKNLDTGVLGTAVGTGSACTATEVQATGRYVFWSCGPAAPTGVYDLDRKQNIPVPAGQYLLGDNYLVRHAASGDLLRYDLTDGILGEAVTLATRPRGTLPDDRNITWAVDKFGGDVAWVDQDNAVHIVEPGVARSAPRAVRVSAADDLVLPGTFDVSAQLSGPVTSPALTLTEVRTGKVVTGTPGTASGNSARASWNGLVGGKTATKGSYRWTLSASADGKNTTLADGTVHVIGGAPVLHGYDTSGRPNLLGLTSAATGAGQWLAVMPGGTALARTGWDTEALTPITAVVPFGDVTKDLRNDLLIRRSDGSMRAFRGDNDLPFQGNTVTAVAGNWNRWDVLVHTGDLTGDGQSDLIARDRATGGLYRIDGDGAGGFKTPVLWATGYKSYTRFIGPGDINGDGKADLLLFIGTDMYAKYGDGKGGLGDRHLVGSGFLGYNAIIGAGDLNEDGKNDLLLRDTAGNLYRRLGDGKGSFGNRLLVGVGYQKFASIY